MFLIGRRRASAVILLVAKVLVYRRRLWSLVLRESVFCFSLCPRFVGSIEGFLEEAQVTRIGFESGVAKVANEGNEADSEVENDVYPHHYDGTVAESAFNFHAAINKHCC